MVLWLLTFSRLLVVGVFRMFRLSTRLRRGSTRLRRRISRFAMQDLELSRLLRPRRIDVCCCGLSKTGTHSVAGIFGRYRSQHHPDAKIRIPLAISLLNGDTELADASRELRVRDQKLWLEMESSTLSGILVEPLMNACPGKKFILTIRDVYSWCDSWFDHDLNRPSSPDSPFVALDRARLRSKDFPPKPFDAPLVELGFPSLACFFQMWARHNIQVLSTVPPDNLFILKTAQITQRLDELVHWVGADRNLLCTDQAWVAKAPRKHHVLGRLDQGYVRDCAKEFCGSLMDRFFPSFSAREYFERSNAP